MEGSGCELMRYYREIPLVFQRNLAGSKIRVDEDLSTEDRKVRKELIPYLKDAKRRGHKAFLRKGTPIVNGKSYDVNYLKENIQLVDENGQMDNPAKTREMTLHSNIAARELDSTLPDELETFICVRNIFRTLLYQALPGAQFTHTIRKSYNVDPNDISRI
jgi:hypothetical protein